LHHAQAYCCFDIFTLRSKDVKFRTANELFDLLTSVVAGIHCNPGAAYTEVGVSEQEVETLAGEKEGCGDDIDFIEVQRPVASADPGIITDSDVLPLMQAS
jgi:hypothetical protein